MLITEATIKLTVSADVDNIFRKLVLIQLTVQIKLLFEHDFSLNVHLNLLNILIFWKFSNDLFPLQCFIYETKKGVK